MRRALIALTVLLGIVVAAAVGWMVRHREMEQVVEVAAAATPTPARPIALLGATLIDSARSEPMADAAIVIDGDRITAVGRRGSVALPAGAEVVELDGKFIIPGLADMHNHLRSGTTSAWQDPGGNARFLLAWGITNLFTPAMDLESVARLKRDAEAQPALYPHFFSTGPILTAGAQPGGIDYAPQTAEEARDAVRELRAAGVDAVKIFHDDLSWLTTHHMPLLAPEVIAAAIDEAHSSGLRVYVHAPILRYAKEALRAGVDGLLHGIISEPVDDELVALMKKNHAVFVATLTLFESCANVGEWTKRERAYDDRGVIPRKAYAELLKSENLEQYAAQWDNWSYVAERLPLARANLKKLFDEGIPVVTGTDTGLIGVVIGVASHLELLLHVEAGLPPREVLRAATINAARMFGHEDEWGSLAAGKLADLLILDASPLDDIRNTRRLYRVMKAGVLHDPEVLWKQMGGMK